MAIKGKGRSKRRGVAAAPKPVYVQPKRPLFARRAVWIPALAVVLAGTIVGIVIGLSSEHHHNQQKALRAKEASIVDRFGHTMDSDLAGVGQPFQTQFQAFPDLTTDGNRDAFGLRCANGLQNVDADFVIESLLLGQ